MINQSDIEGRLRLLRYGLIVVVLVTLMVSLLAPYVATRELGTAITDFLMNSIIFTVVVGVISVAIYIGYSNLLKKNAGSGSS